MKTKWKTPELRFATNPIEVRAAADGTVEFDGYACVYDFAYDVAGGPDNGGWTETVSRGAGVRTLSSSLSVPLVVDHSGWVYARFTRTADGVTTGDMELLDDPYGLRVRASLDGSSPQSQSLASAVRRGDYNAMSYAFVVPEGRSIWSDNGRSRMITEYSLNVTGADVSIVTNPANPATVAQIRSAANVPVEQPAGMDADTLRAIRDRYRISV